MNSYANRFLELRSKIDPNNNIPVAHIVLKFVQGLLPQLMTITYASNSRNVQQAIDTAKRLEGGLSLATQQQNAYLLEEKVTQLSEQILAMQGQPAKIPIYQSLQKRQSWQAKSGAKQGFICFNC